MKYKKLFVKQNHRDSASTLEAANMIGIRLKNDTPLPMSVFLCALTTAAVICMTEMLARSFGLFGADSAEPVRILFTSPEIRRFYFFVTIGCLLICSASALYRHSVKTTLSLLFIYAAVCGYHYKYVADGFIRALNKGVFEIYAVTGQTPRQYYLTTFGVDEPKSELLWFMYTVIFGVCFLMAYFGVRRCSSFWFAVPVMMAAGIPLSFNCLDGEGWFAAAAVICLLMYTINVQGYRRTVSKNTVTRFGKTLGIHGKYAAYSAFQQSVMMLTAALAVVFVLYQFNDFDNYKKSDKADKLGQDILYSVENLTFGTVFEELGFGTSNSLGRGQLSSLGDLEYTGKVMFEISSSSSEKLYMRAFSASNYTGKRWEQTDEKTYKSYDFWKEFRENGLYPQLIYTDTMVHVVYGGDDIDGGIDVTVMPGFDPDAAITLSIRNKAINHKTFLTDYRMLPELSEDAVNAASYKYDGDFTFDKFGGLNSYKETIAQIGSEVTHPAYIGVVPDNDDMGDSLKEILRNGEFVDDTAAMYSYWSEDIAEAREAFYDRERKYRAFVVENYTDYPENIMDYLPEDFDERTAVIYQGCVDHFENAEDSVFWLERYYEFTENYIREYLHENAEYTLSPGKTPRDRDFVEYFLNENHKGYCVHFATSAALMLRRAGIPARYCEGYFVSSDELDKRYLSQGGYAKIPDSSAHAWVEVYYPLAGWRPVEFTPYYSDGSKPDENKQPFVRANVSSDSDDEDSDDEDSEDSEDSEEDTEEQTDSGAQSDTTDSDTFESDSETSSERGDPLPAATPKKPSRFLKALLSFVKTAVIIAAVVALWLLVRFAVCTIRKMRFESADTRKAAIVMYFYALRVMRLMGIAPKKGEGVEAFALRSSREHHSIGSREMRAFTKTALSARFGKAPPDKRDTAAMRVFIGDISKKMYETKPKWRKLIIKYLLFFD